MIRALWDTQTREVVRVEGRHHRAVGAKRGRHPPTMPIWVGANRPRMLRLIGRVADGWLPSLGYLGGRDRLPALNAVIDESAQAAGREPSAVRRLLNIGPGETDRDSLPTSHWPTASRPSSSPATTPRRSSAMAGRSRRRSARWSPWGGPGSRDAAAGQRRGVARSRAPAAGRSATPSPAPCPLLCP